MIGINRKDIRAVFFYFHRIALVKEQFVILVRKSDEYIFPGICRKNVVKSRKSSAKENVTPCTARSVHKFFKKISTHILTVLIIGVILRIEQKTDTASLRCYASHRFIN